MIDERTKRIDEFIRKMDQHEIEFTANASVEYGIEGKNTLGQSKREITGTLSDHLSRALQSYQDTKPLEHDRISQALHFTNTSQAILWINRAETIGAVKASDSIFTKYADSVKELEKRQQDNEVLYSELRNKEAEYSELIGRYKELDEKLNKIFIKKGET